MDPCVEELWGSASCSAFFVKCHKINRLNRHLSVVVDACMNSVGEQKCCLAVLACEFGEFGTICTVVALWLNHRGWKRPLEIM